MNFWWVAVKDSLILGRDRKALVTLILMPMILIGILGAAFGNMFSGDDVKIEKFSIGIVNNDGGEYGRALKEEVFEKSLKDLVDVKAVDEEEMYSRLRDKKLKVGIIIGSDFSNSIKAGNETTVKLVSIPSANIPAMIAENVVQQFSREASVQSAGVGLAIEAAAVSGKPVQIEALLADLDNGAKTTGLIKKKAAGEGEKTVSSFQYYAAGMAVMFLLMTVVNGVSAMIEEKEQEVYKRLLVSKLTHFEYVAGKLAGLLFLSMIQLSAIILGTRFLFDVDWGNSVSGTILIGGCFVFSACGLGVMAGSFMKTEKAFGVAGSLATQIMAAVGGSMVPLYVFPDWVNSLARLLPNALALQSFLAVMSGEGVVKVVPEAAALFGLGLLFLAIGWLRLTIERRGKYA